MSHVPSPDIVVSELEPVTPTLYWAMEVGTERGRIYFDQRSLRPEPFLFANIVRYEARTILEDAGVSTGFDLDDLANNGMSIRYCSYVLRVRKTDDGQAPVPGRSQRLQAFYHQLELGLLGPVSSESLNLLVLWNVDHRFLLDPVFTLACPRQGGQTRSSVANHWSVPMANPAFVDAPALPVGRPLSIPSSTSARTG